MIKKEKCVGRIATNFVVNDIGIVEIPKGDSGRYRAAYPFGGVVRGAVKTFLH